MKWMKLLASALLVSGITTASFAQQAITLHGASQFGDDHAFTKTMVRFEELVKNTMVSLLILSFIKTVN